MDFATETLFSVDSPDSGFGLFKLVRLARTFRGALIAHPAAYISIVGCLAPTSTKSYNFDDNLSRMGDRIKAARDRLTAFGVLEHSITGYVPLAAAPIAEDLIVVTARDTPKVHLLPGMKRVPFGDESIDPYDDAATQARIVVDPFASPKPSSNTQIIVGYTLIPKGLQAVSGPPDPLNPLRTQHQFSFTITRARHPQKGGGPEDSIQGSVTLNDKGEIVNIQVGGQGAAMAKPLLDGWIQVSGFVQLMVTVNWSKTASGQAVIVPVVQSAVGGQIVVTPKIKGGGGLFKFLRENVQIGIQGMGTANLPAAPPQAAPFAPAPSVGAQGTFIVNIPFDL
jgi:hypothetical protein